jgi:D-cysteine desulfhydrase
MVKGEPALFRRFPELRERVPRHPFVEGATPVAPLQVEGVGGELFVKRDDLSCPLYGGNKPRKLEFAIGAALAWGSRRLVTTGGIGTHHGLATAILGRSAGLSTTLVLVPQPVTDEVVETLQLHAAYGAEQVFASGVPAAALRVVQAFAGAALRGERPFYVPTGGSGARGNLGFVSAGLELAEQVKAGELPEPAEIFLPVGTGGTTVGLVLGLKLAGLTTRVTGVLVTDILPPSSESLARAARATLRFLRRRARSVPQVPLEARDFPLVRDQLGGGYGAPTPAAREAVAAAARAGLELETTYSGKCLAAMRAGASVQRGPVLFWNTYSAVDVARAAPLRPDPSLVPEPLQRFLRAPRV